MDCLTTPSLPFRHWLSGTLLVVKELIIDSSGFASEIKDLVAGEPGVLLVKNSNIDFYATYGSI